MENNQVEKQAENKEHQNKTEGMRIKIDLNKSMKDKIRRIRKDTITTSVFELIFYAIVLLYCMRPDPKDNLLKIRDILLLILCITNILINYIIIYSTNKIKKIMEDSNIEEFDLSEIIDKKFILEKLNIIKYVIITIIIFFVYYISVIELLKKG
jgi:hypothetical protein